MRTRFSTIPEYFTSLLPAARFSSVRRTDPERWLSLGMALLAVAAAAYIGRAVFTAPAVVLFLPFLLLVPVILRNPAIGLYLLIPVGQWVPYWVRVPVPVFDSPLAVVALFTVAAAAAHWARHHTVWPRNWLYLPLLVAASILGLAWLSGYGPEAFMRFYIFVEALLPFFLVILLIDSPRKARILLLSITLPLLLRAAAVWPIALFYGDESLQVFRAIRPDEWTTWLLGLNGPNLATNLSLIVPLILGLTLLAPRKWQRIGVAFLALAVTGALVLTTYVAALMNLGVAVIVVTALGHKRLYHRLLSAILLLGGLLVFVGLLGHYVPNVKRLLVGAWQELVVGSLLRVDRLAMLRGDLEVFRRFPWVGVGAITRYATSSGVGQLQVQGQVFGLGGHNSISMIAYEYGIILLLSWLAIFAVTGWTLLGLYRTVRYWLDRAFVVGFIGIWAIVLVKTLTSTILFQPTSMHIFWTCMGLAVVWDEWLRREPDACLVDWQW